MNAETAIVQEIRLAVGGQPGARLFRNNVGALEDKTGRWVTYGLCEGSADLVGWRTVKVTPEMVGAHVAVFLAIEVKRPGGRGPTEAQDAFLTAVARAGGRAGVARSAADAMAIADGLQGTL